MHILVFGGTGACGKAFILEALHAGHELTLYARNPSKFSSETTENSGVHVVKGEFTDIDALRKALDFGPEVLVSFAGPMVPSKGMLDPPLLRALNSIL
ncbi:uncharacterized protein LTR77_005548 [Saxophila tyrrhenica]|uniref:NAD(P)-binding domain-containing protein n=1 Tax=Saxophila tyrrhenica TaxID=1690608 RepID=A0AAV9P920_9PEZI|nr:hypothetical protein LTR77_005548 [Saxophila tyrrhenica]